LVRFGEFGDGLWQLQNWLVSKNKTRVAGKTLIAGEPAFAGWDGRT
jgi:hypothetical protein